MTDHGVRDRIVIVTGAGRGIGRGIARHLAHHGAVVAVAEYRRERLDEAVAELDELGAPSLGLECDVGQRESVFAMVDGVIERFGRVDAIVNNAQSFRPVMPLEDVSESDMEVLHRTGTSARCGGCRRCFPTCARPATGAS